MKRNNVKNAVIASTEDLEGGEELRDSMRVAETLFRPANDAVSAVTAAQKKRIRKKARDAVIKRAVREVPKQTSKKVVKETAKTTAKVTAQTVAGVSATAAGTVAGFAAGPGGTLVGFAVGALAGELEGEKIDRRFFKMGNRSRIFSFFRTELGDPGNQKNGDFNGNLFKTLGSLIVRNLFRIIRKVAKVGLRIILLLLCIVMILVMPLLIILLILYNSPFSIFLPKIGHTPTVREVAEDSYIDFRSGIRKELKEIKGYYDAEFTGVFMEDSEGQRTFLGDDIYLTEKNINDVLLIYMVKYGVDDMAAEMNDKGKKRLKEVFDDMVIMKTDEYSYTVTLERDIPDKDGKPTGKKEKYDEERKVKTIEVVLHGADEFAVKYDFNKKKMKLFEEMKSMIK